MKRKYFLLFIAFIISWTYSVLIFYPQPGRFDWLGTTILTLLYGFSWIIPMTFFALGIFKKGNRIRKIIASKYFTIGLILILGTFLYISWNTKFSNDLIFIGFWTLTTLLWWNTYLNLKILQGI
ncbi:hypothetical protein [Aquimarina celericrescens]|uniref:Uncharacterized protein n=1 Tax=Aquimarina celericrescens TaxID=1964542 RepID=A0ABW5B2C8_9FLAO|nr:hypothetical protein [Aquimarina celericrescens]